MTIDVSFIDGERTARMKSDPRYPDGQAISLAPSVLAKACTRNLPYPAPRCGLYSIKCRVCGFVGVVTVAGRPDDPRVVTIPCKPKGLS